MNRKHLFLAALLLFAGIFANAQQGSNISIVPRPLKLEEGTGYFNITATTAVQLINADSELTANANLFCGQLIPGFQKPNVSASKTELANNVIVLAIDPKITAQEGYVLDVTNQKIRIAASTARGIFYGIQTLTQLHDGDKLIQPGNMMFWSVPEVHIEDAPKFGWRGMHLDVSRHFYSLEYLMRYIDILALYKFNTFHLHLTDDQGWRLEIKKYPKLTEKGAWRTLNNQDSACLEMAKTNPDFNLPKEFFKKINGKEMYGGFYTQAQMKALISYAAQRNITIVPEVDMPGHMMAAIKAYPGLTCLQEDGWGKDFSTPLCPCKEEVYNFLEGVMSEIVALFPSAYIHIGADEVEKTTWAQSDVCKQLMEREGIKSVNELQSYFVKRMEKFLNGKGKKMIGWDEVLEGGVNPSTTIMYWRGWVKNAPVTAAKTGNHVIMTPTDYSYFDYQQDAKTLEKLYTAKVIPDGLSAAEAANIIGVQGNLWTEYIPTTARLEYMVFPRALAMAELGWSADRDYADFTRRMDAQYRLLERLHINFRMPDIGNLKERMVFTDSAVLSLDMPPMLSAIRYTTDGSLPTLGSPVFHSPMLVRDRVELKVAAFTNFGRRGDVSSIVFDKQDYLKPAITADEVKPGLTAGYYEGTLKNLTSLAVLTPKRSYDLKGLEVPSDHGSGSFGLFYNGFINVPEKGIYTFYLNADDGANLIIGGRTVIENDGPHAPKEKNGQIALDAGLHPFSLPFFEAGGGFTLELRWEGPGVNKQLVLPGVLFTKK